MSKFTYGSGKSHSFTILTSLNKSNNTYIAKLNYQNYIRVSYKDYTRLCISCDKGPDLCEGSTFSAIDLSNDSSISFLILRIFKTNDIWLMELKKCDI